MLFGPRHCGQFSASASNGQRSSARKLNRSQPGKTRPGRPGTTRLHSPTSRRCICTSAAIGNRWREKYMRTATSETHASRIAGILAFGHRIGNSFCEALEPQCSSHHSPLPSAPGRMSNCWTALQPNQATPPTSRRWFTGFCTTRIADSSEVFGSAKAAEPPTQGHWYLHNSPLPAWGERAGVRGRRAER